MLNTVANKSCTHSIILPLTEKNALEWLLAPAVQAVFPEGVLGIGGLLHPIYIYPWVPCIAKQTDTPVKGVPTLIARKPPIPKLPGIILFNT